MHPATINLMKNIVYVSTAIKLLPQEQLMDILNTSRVYNAAHHISGVLLYAEGTFIQVLEGDDTEVDEIFSKIKTDFRHKNIIKLIDDTISTKSFSAWLMGFALVEAKPAKDLLGYLNANGILNHSGSESPSVNTIKTFIESNGLKITI